jgi:flagellar basal-body rod modification protein FlgD
MTISGTNIRTLSDLTSAPSTTSSTSNTTSSTSSALGAGQTLGKDQFMKLMVAQLKNQDPLDPAKNGEFLAQLAQFSSLEGITNLNNSVTAMAASMRSTVASQAATLVGRSVLVPTNQTLMQGNGLMGEVNVTQPTNDLTVEISDSSGASVKRLSLGSQQAGTSRFTWDGTDNNGVAQAPGVYKVTAYSGGNSSQAFAVDLPEYVVSVSLGQDGAQLNLAGGTTVPVADVKEIQ